MFPLGLTDDERKTLLFGNWEHSSNIKEENIIRKGEVILNKDRSVFLAGVGIDHIVPEINKETQSELDLCKSILKSMSSKSIIDEVETDGFAYKRCVFCNGDDYSVLNTVLNGIVVHEKDCDFIKAKSVIGDYE
jgi:hypothetical protein